MTSSQVLVRTPNSAASRYSMLLTNDAEHVREAQRLRHQVFVGELGAVLHGSPDGLDVDPFDEFCDHLVIREDATGEIVGTYRMLPPEGAAAAGRLYVEGEFEASALDPLRPSLVEVGRACVHPDHRDGSVIGLVWAGIAGYMMLTGHKWLTGCGSVPLDDGGKLAATVWDRVLARHLSPPELRAQPLRPWNPKGVRRQLRSQPPPLLRGYLRLGAWVCGPPAHDPDFDCADFLVLLGMDHIDARYLRYFLGGGARA